MENFYEYLVKEYNAYFSGWDFSYVKGRLIEDKLPWKYANIVEKYSLGKNYLLDMDTGGGEVLCSLKDLPKNVYATESYELNIPVAEKALKEKKIILKPIKSSGEIPFDNEYFDIIINRHGSYNINILKNKLKKDGIFITQQVGGMNGIDMNMAFNTKTMDYVDWCLIENIENFNGKWHEVTNPFYASTNELANKAMKFLYDNELIIGFDWGKWDEGRDFFKNNNPNKYNDINREFILKLLTAIARNDKFCIGAWGELFESGTGIILFKKLFETYKN